ALNEILKDVDFEYIHVDFEIPIESMNKNIIKQICELENLWGKGVEEPYLAITNININKSNLQLIGSKKDTISLKYNGIAYIMFRQDYATYEEIRRAKKINVIGKAGVNEYQGNVNYQVIIEGFEVIS